MRLPQLAPIGALSAVAGGVVLLGASLGGIVSVDRELAASVPGTAGALTARSVVDTGDGERSAPAWTSGGECAAGGPARAIRRAPRLRMLRLVDDQGARHVVVIVDRRQADRCDSRAGHGKPAV